VTQKTLHAPLNAATIWYFARLNVALRAALPWWRRWGPLFAVAGILGIAIASSEINYYANGPKLAGFAQIGHTVAGRSGLQRQAIGNDVGYDGQYYFLLAYDPASVVRYCKNEQDARCHVAPRGLSELRAERILYPMTVRVLALGQLSLIPIMLLLVNVFAILMVAELMGQMAVAAGRSRWWGAATALFCGMTLGLLRDLADPYAVMWLVLAVFLLRQERWRWAALAGAAALLTRESLIIFIPLLAMPLLAQRRWGLLAQYAAITFVPFIAYQIVLYGFFGKWALLTGDSSAAQLVHIPFAGFWEERKTLDFSVIALGVVLPLVGSIVLAVCDTVRRGWRSLLSDPVPLTVVLYGVLLSLTYWFQWADIWGASRLAAPAVVLGTLVVMRVPWGQWRSAYMTLLGMSAIIPLLVIQR
jgi:hypothetical protein